MTAKKIILYAAERPKVAAKKMMLKPIDNSSSGTTSGSKPRHYKQIECHQFNFV